MRLHQRKHKYTGPVSVDVAGLDKTNLTIFLSSAPCRRHGNNFQRIVDPDTRWRWVVI